MVISIIGIIVCVYGNVTNKDRIFYKGLFVGMGSSFCFMVVDVLCRGILLTS